MFTTIKNGKREVVLPEGACLGYRDNALIAYKTMLSFLEEVMGSSICFLENTPPRDEYEHWELSGFFGGLEFHIAPGSNSTTPLRGFVGGETISAFSAEGFMESFIKQYRDQWERGVRCL
jgi:hypothetical protein